MSLRQDLQKTLHRKKQSELFRRALIGIGILGILATVIAFLFYIPSLRITKLIISGLSPIDEKQLRREVLAALATREYFIIPKDHLLFFPKNEIYALLQNKFRVRAFKLEKDFPSTIKIEVTERETWAVWCSADATKCLLLDKDGLAFESATGFSGSAILKIVDARGDDFIGKNILPLENFLKIRELVEKAPGIMKETVGTINIKSSGKTYLIYAKSGWYMLIDDETDVPKALENLRIALNSEIKENRKNLEYIDLRFQDKIFYRYR